MLERYKEVEAYGKTWHDVTFLDIEYACYFQARSEENGEYIAAKHFRNITRILWPPDENGKGGYIWLSEDPDLPPESHWNDTALIELLRNRYVGITGPASSTKSELLAVWALVNWLPLANTCFVLVASTTIAGAKKRVWASIKERFLRLSWVGIGRYSEHPQPMITANRGDDATKHLSDRSSISLVAPDSGKEGEAIGKLIGLKQEHFIVIADELDDMSSAITNACSNWSKNPDFQFVGATNIASTLGTFGRFFAPIDGWPNVKVTDQRWETKNGVCIHYDGVSSSPNRFSKPIDKYPFIIKVADMEQDAKNYGETSSRFWRFDRGFPPPTGDDDNLYSEMELLSQGCMEPAIWRGDFTNLAALDPNYSKAQGDQCMAKFGKIGLDRDGLRVLDMGGPEGEIAIRENVERMDEGSATKQKAVQFVKLCQDRNIGVRQVVVDCTGGGSLMADAVEDAFGQRGLLRVEFGGEASDRIVETQGKIEIRAKDKYGNKASEMWHVGIQYVKARQIRGLTSKQVEQMSTRKTFEKNRKVWIEQKRDYKLRTQKPSPDESDGGFLVLELACDRFAFASKSATAPASKSQDWGRAFSRFNPAKREGEQRLAKWGSL